MLPADPTTGDWAAAIVAAGLVVVVGALLLLRPALRDAPRQPWGRVAGFAFAMLTVGILLCVVVVCAAGIRAAGVDLGAFAEGGDGDPSYPQGTFAGVLVDPDPDVTEHVARYSTAVLLPLAAVFGVLAFAIVTMGRRSSLRIPAVVAAALLIALALVLVGTDPGSLVTGVAWAALGLAVLGVVALGVDELSYPRSSSSTTRSQRSLQSAQR